MSRKGRMAVRKTLLVFGAFSLWMLFTFPYAHYNYYPGDYPRGLVLWEVERHVETYTVPEYWRWLVADVGGEYYSAQGFVPCWNTLDKEIYWPGMLAAATAIVALCGSGFWISRDRQGRPAQASPYHTWDAAPDDEQLSPAPRTLA
jgi:hypothetical protein